MSVDYSELVAFRDSLLAFDQAESEIAISCVNELCGRFLRKAVKRTPTGVYNEAQAKTGGTLKRGWQNPERKMTFTPRQYQISLTNPVEYASYVEYGHRQHPGQFVPGLGDDGKGRRLVKSWVDGQFIMTKSETEVQDKADEVVRRRFKKALRNIK